jgi:pyruvate/2-oxoacid:ferredoxin oxidoreductase beta subunit
MSKGVSIIEMYELCVINEYKTDEKEYLNIFKILQSIRLPIDEIKNMKKIIIC